MPRNAATKHMLTIYTFDSFPRVTRFRLQSVTLAPRAEIHWRKFKNEVHRLAKFATCECPLQMNKIWFRGSLFKKPKVCRCGMHLETLRSNDGFFSYMKLPQPDGNI